MPGHQGISVSPRPLQDSSRTRPSRGALNGREAEGAPGPALASRRSGRHRGPQAVFSKENFILFFVLLGAAVLAVAVVAYLRTFIR